MALKHSVAICSSAVRRRHYMDFATASRLFCGFRREKDVDRRSIRSPARRRLGERTPFTLLEAALGLEFDAQRGEIRLRNPRLPAFLNEVVLRDLLLGASSVDLRVRRHATRCRWKSCGRVVRSRCPSCWRTDLTADRPPARALSSTSIYAVGSSHSGARMRARRLFISIAVASAMSATAVSWAQTTQVRRGRSQLAAAASRKLHAPPVTPNPRGGRHRKTGAAALGHIIGARDAHGVLGATFRSAPDEDMDASRRDRRSRRNGARVR